MQPLLNQVPKSLKAMAGNSGWLLTRTASSMVVGFITAVWLTRYLGPEDFGLYSYVIALVMIFAGVSSVGMNALVTRELVERPDDRDSILGTALAIRVVGSLAAAAVLVVVAFAMHPDLDYRLALVLFGSVILVQPLEITSLFYEAQTKSRDVVLVDLAASAAYACLVLVFIALGLSVIWFLGARLFSVAATRLGVLLIFALQGHEPTKWRPDPQRAKGLLLEAWPLIISSLGATLYLRIDQVMLGQLASAEDVGIYAAAARLSEIWYFVPALIVVSAFPYLIRLRDEDRSAYADRLQQLYDLLFWAGFAVAAATTILAPWLIATLYGEAYAASTRILQIHVWAGVFIFMRAAFSKWLIVERLLVFSLVTQGAGAIVNILLNLVLIPQWAGVGAAWATVISYATASFLALLLFRPTRSAASMMTKTVGAPVRYARASMGRRSNG